MEGVLCESRVRLSPPITFRMHYLPSFVLTFSMRRAPVSVLHLTRHRALLQGPLRTLSSEDTVKAWATSILQQGDKNKKSHGAQGTEETLKRPTNKNPLRTERVKKAPVYRRRTMGDNSWTTEPMDEKLIWVDCEMTGLDYNKEMIMEIGVVITDGDLNEIARQDSLIIQVPEDLLDGMGAWCVKHHGDSGLTEACRSSKLESSDVDKHLLAFVQKYTKLNECPMAGNSIYMDRIFIQKQFPSFHSHFHYRNVDVSTIKEITRRWFPAEYSQAPKKSYEHRVMGDIADSIAELKYYRNAVFKQEGSKQVSAEEKRIN